MKVFTLISVMIWGANLCAQVSDSFSDGNITDNPAWSGNLADFKVQDGVLKSASAVSGAVYALSTPSAIALKGDWQWHVSLQFNTSSSNYTDVFLIADSADVLKAKNGYFVRIGSSKDDICLYKLLKGKSTKLIDGTDAVLNKSLNTVRVRVTRDKYRRFMLYRSDDGGDWQQEGWATDSSILFSSSFGIRVKQSTASFFYKHTFDNILVQPLAEDTTAPQVDTLWAADNQALTIQFSEITDTAAAMTAGNYQLNINDKPVAVTQLGDRQYQLQFDNAFESGRRNVLEIYNITDIWDNTAKLLRDSFTFYRLDTAQQNDIVITEIMADPEAAAGLPDEEYIELFNRSSKYVLLDACRISDGSYSSTTPAVIMPPQTYLKLSAENMIAFPSLNNTGETISLYNQRFELVHSVTYTDKLYGDAIKAQGGWSLEMTDTDNPCNVPGNWKASIDSRGGTPGLQNSVKDILPDKESPRISEAFAISDSIVRLLQSETIDSVTSIAATYMVSDNRSLILAKADMENNMLELKLWPPLSTDSIYRLRVAGLRDCAGNVQEEQWFDLALPQTVHASDIVINEILFDPHSNGYDFVELYNRSEAPIALNDLYLCNTDAAGKRSHCLPVSASGMLLFPGQYVLLSEDEQNICSHYICSPNLVYRNLPDMISMPDDEGVILLSTAGGLTIDSLHYTDDWHFPLLNDKEGVSLERLDPGRASNSPGNWNSAASVVGFATPGYRNSQYTLQPQKTGKLLYMQRPVVSPDNDGYEDVLDISYHLDKTGYTANLYIFNIDGIQVKHLLNNETLLQDGVITWNGMDDNNQKAAIGIYMIFFEAFDSNGAVLQEKTSCVVAGRI